MTPDFTTTSNCAYRKDAESIKILLDAGADVNAKDDWDMTPLMLAMSLHKKENIKTLLASGADVNAKDNEGKTVLMHAVVGYMIEEEHVKILLDAGADVEVKDDRGNTALMMAVRSCQSGIIDMLKNAAK